jgi:hypothetical protein
MLSDSVGNSVCQKGVYKEYSQQSNDDFLPLRASGCPGRIKVLI